MTKGGCEVAKATGVFGFLNANGTWMITSDLGTLEGHCKCVIVIRSCNTPAMQNVLGSGVIDVQINKWYLLDIEIDV